MTEVHENQAVKIAKDVDRPSQKKLGNLLVSLQKHRLSDKLVQLPRCIGRNVLVSYDRYAPVLISPQVTDLELGHGLRTWDMQHYRREFKHNDIPAKHATVELRASVLD